MATVARRNMSHCVFKGATFACGVPEVTAKARAAVHAHFRILERGRFDLHVSLGYTTREYCVFLERFF